MKTDIPLYPYWQSFSVSQSTQSEVAAGWLANNVTTASVAGSSSHRQCIEAICASALRPVPVASVSEDLGANFIGPRGKTFAGALGDLIDGILNTYADVWWWITEQGLHIGTIEPEYEVAGLDPFDRFVGPLVEERWSHALSRANTNLSEIALEEITERVDAEGFVLKENLQPAAREELARYNQKNNRDPVRTFSGAIQRPLLVRIVRLRFVLARTRYLKAEKTVVVSPMEAIPTCFWSFPIS